MTRLLLSTIAACTIALAAVPPPAPSPNYGARVECQEDDPCWSCSVHGNGVCGDLRGGTR